MNNNRIWIVINAGGNSRPKEVPDRFNADACASMTNQKVIDGMDIVSETRFTEAKQKLRPGDKIVMHQGGGKPFRKKGYDSGMLVSVGYFVSLKELNSNDITTHQSLYNIIRKYYPNTNLAGLLQFNVKRVNDKLPIESIGVRPWFGDNFVEITPSHVGYDVLNRWWLKNIGME